MIDMVYVYDNYFQTAISIARRYVRDYDTAQDIAQESMIKVWRKYHKFDSAKSSFFTWLFNIVRNTAIDTCRAKTSRVTVREEPETGLQYFECDCINIDTIDIHTHLSKLEDSYRYVIKLSFIDGYTQEGIAELLGMPLGTVKSKTKIGIRELRKIYQE